VEPGYKATDNCDGDLTGQVSVTGYVDGNTLGDYVLMYTVVDAYNNLTSVSRTVTVQAPSKPLVNPSVVNPDGKVIYLTFDDGPGPRTPELLDILAKYNVKATFFVVNTKFIDTIARIAREGHTVGIHSTTHKFNEIYVNEDAYFHDLYTMQDIIRSFTGQESTILRFPGGSSNTVSAKYNQGIMSRLTQQVHEKGFRYFDWNVDSKDAGGAKTATQVYNNVVRGIGTKQYSIVLQHDIKGYSIDAVEGIIVWGLQNGYTFLPLTQDSPICQHNIKN
jgi:peptidoglycan/xylan/chitin deacetylase (PgdA/CDA1 family)